MWVWNVYGKDHMHGWVYQQGDWSWGCVLTWHVAWMGLADTYAGGGGINLDDWGHGKYWSCYLWKWDEDIGWQYRKINYGASNRPSALNKPVAMVQQLRPWYWD